MEADLEPQPSSLLNERSLQPGGCTKKKRSRSGAQRRRKRALQRQVAVLELASNGPHVKDNKESKDLPKQILGCVGGSNVISGPEKSNDSGEPSSSKCENACIQNLPLLIEPIAETLSGNSKSDSPSGQVPGAATMHTGRKRSGAQRRRKRAMKLQSAVSEGAASNGAHVRDRDIPKLIGIEGSDVAGGQSYNSDDSSESECEKASTPSVPILITPTAESSCGDFKSEDHTGQVPESAAGLTEKESLRPRRKRAMQQQTSVLDAAVSNGTNVNARNLPKPILGSIGRSEEEKIATATRRVIPESSNTENSFEMDDDDEMWMFHQHGEDFVV